MKTTVLHLSRSAMTQVAAARLVALALAKGVRVHLEIAPGAHLSPGTHFDIEAGDRRDIQLSLHTGTRIESGALLRLTSGAEVHLGPDVLVRRNAVLNVAGHLQLLGNNLISWGSVIHCADRVVFGDRDGTGDGVTVVDGTHHRGTDDGHWYHHARTAPIDIGPNVWLASHCTITAGVRIGASSTVAAGSVVLSDVPAQSVVAGAPARIMKSADTRSPS